MPPADRALGGAGKTIRLVAPSANRRDMPNRKAKKRRGEIPAPTKRISSELLEELRVAVDVVLVDQDIAEIERLLVNF